MESNTALSIVVFAPIVQLFDIIMPLTGGGPSNQTHSMVTYLYYFGVMRMKFGFGSAIGVVIFLICFSIALT